MKLWHFLAVVALGWWAAGCSAPIQKTCRPLKDMSGGKAGCVCRDAKTGRFVKCPPPR